MSAYYNDIDPFAAAWLRELIKAGHIAPGEVDTRSIEDVDQRDLEGFTQCHFFAGIGVWSYALRCAGWPDNRPVWTGSCPCQPFSSSGKQRGFDDKRHLWPEFYRLISQRRPTVCFGEQVASKPGLEWLDLVQTNLEKSGYAFGAVDTCSAGVGAPHLRQRLYWVADSNCRGFLGGASGCEQYAKEHGNLAKCLPSGGLGYSNDTRPQGRCGVCQCTTKRTAWESCVVDGLAHSEIAECERCRPAWSGRKRFTDDCPSFRMDNAECIRRRARRDNDGRHDGQQLDAARHAGRPGPVNGHWRDADWIYCRDGKWRAVEPGTFPLAHGSAARVGRLRGYGNAINAPQATEIIAAYLSICL